MSEKLAGEPRNGFCIYIKTFFQGPVPTVTDGDDKYVVFASEFEAQKEILDHALMRWQQFKDGERDFEDAIAVEEYVVAVTVNPHGIITDENGKRYGVKAD